MRRLLAIAAPAIAACGLGITGAATGDGDGGLADATSGEADASTPGDASISDASVDEPLDAPVDTSVPPDPTKVSVSYAIGKNAIVYRFDALTNLFTPLPSVGCPSGEETAVFSDGSVFVTSSSSTALYRLTATGCTEIKSGSTVPYALGTAPAGTVSPTEETLVGYLGADYVRVDRTTGNVVTITSGALGNTRPSGDVTAIGTKGYLAAASSFGLCPSNGDCVVEVNLATGVPIKLVKQLVGFGIFGIAHSKGQLLLYANGAVYPFDPSTAMLGAAMASWPAGASFSGAGSSPYP